MLRTLAAVVVLASLASGAGRRAWSDEPPRSPQEVAGLVKEAHAAGGSEQIAEWARRDVPDPWLVADALLAGGARAAAEAFARAAPRKDVERLPAFVASWQATEGDAAGRRAIETGNAALTAEKLADALAVFEAAAPSATAVVALRLAHGSAIALRRLERAAEAARRFEAVAQGAENLGWLARAAAALLDVARSEQAAQRPEAALAAAQRLLALETSRGLPSRVAEAHLLIAMLEDARGNIDAATTAFEQALEGYEKAGDGRGAARALNDLADMLRRQAAWERAEQAARQALARAEAVASWDEAARSHATQGLIQQKQGRLDAAISSFERALAAAEKAGDQPKLLWVVYQLGQSHDLREKEGDLARALELYARAEQGFQRLGDARGAAAAAVNAADCSFRLGRDDEALAQAERALALGRRAGVAYLEGRALHVKGLLAERQGQAERARSLYVEAEARFTAAGDRIEAARSAGRGADMLRTLGGLAQAREQAERVLALAESLGDRGVEALALLVLARTARDEGRREEALALARRSRAAYAAIQHAQALGVAERLIAELEQAAPR